EHEILDCSTYQVLARIPRSYDNSWGYTSWNWRRQKLYVGFNPFPESLVVIDMAADTLVTTIAGSGMGSAYVASTDRLYRGTESCLVALDCAADTVVRTIPSPLSGYQFFYPAWDSVGDKLYVSLGGWALPPKVTVYDCATDSLLTIIDIPDPYRTHEMNFDYVHDKAYYSTNGLSGRGGVIDTRQDTVVKRFPFDAIALFNTEIALNTKDHKAYVLGTADTATGGSALYVIDCDTDSVVRKIEFPHRPWPVQLVRWVPWSNRVYVSWMNVPAGFDLGMYVVDCNTDSLIVDNWVLGYWPPYDFQIDPVRERVFAIGCESTSVHVLRDTGYGGVVEARPAGPRLASVLQVQPTSGGYEVSYSVASPCRVDLSVSDLIGREVRQLVTGEQPAGRHRAIWDRRDQEGAAVPGGIYFVHLSTPDFAAVKKAVVTR
ncbi:hypothetical protein FJY68_14200, partial [candidate division WOR-3 bacterium]|nr:hypothetical protein [candidate division WOR-3 bacterium]